ncbi:MAG: hypothetical protein KDK39_02505 [Leptospiraceae bacterium]|nr:hypothetical protein [Leptospiraceae bacterium]
MVGTGGIPPDASQRVSRPTTKQLQPVQLGKVLGELLRARIGQVVDLEVLKVAADGQRAELRIAGQRFEALLQGVRLQSGQGIAVLVRQIKDSLQLVVLDPSTLVQNGWPGLQAGSATSAQGGLTRLANLFWLVLNGSRQGSASQWQESPLQARDLKNLRAMARHLQKSGMRGAFLGELVQLISGDEISPQYMPDQSLVASWLVQLNPDARQAPERWQMQAIGRSAAAPLYYFFQFQDGVGLSIAGAALSTDPQFSQLSIWLLVKPARLAAQLDEQADYLKKLLQKEGIDLLQLETRGLAESSELNLWA